MLRPSYLSVNFEQSVIAKAVENCQEAIQASNFDRVERAFRALKSLQIDTFLRNSPDAFVNVLLERLRLAENLVKQDQLSVLAVAFELDHKGVQEVAFLSREEAKFFLTSWLCRDANLSEVCKTHEKDVDLILPFRRKVRQLLECAVANADPATPERIIRQMQSAVESRDPDRYQLLSYSYLTFVAEDAIILDDIAGFARQILRLAQFTQSFLKERDAGTHAEYTSIILGGLRIDIQSDWAKIVTKLMEPAETGFLCQQIINNHEIFGEIARNLGLSPHANLPAIRDRVMKELVAHGIEPFEESWEQVLEKFFTVLGSNEHVFDEVGYHYLRVQTLLQNSFYRYDVQEFAHQLLMLAKRIRDFVQQGGRSEYFRTFFDKEYVAFALADNFSPGTLALFLHQELELRDWASFGGWTQKAYQGFLSATRSVIQKKAPIAEVQLIITRLIQSADCQELVSVHRSEWEALLDFAYYSGDTQSFAELIEGTASAIEANGGATTPAVTNDRELALLTLLIDALPEDIEGLQVSLAKQDKPGVRAALLQYSTQRYSRETDSEQDSKKCLERHHWLIRSQNEREEDYPGTWRPLIREHEFLPILQQFHGEVARILALSDCEYRYRYTEGWRDATVTRVDQCQTSVMEYQEGLQAALASQLVSELKSKRILRRQLLDKAFFTGDTELCRQICEVDIQALIHAGEAGKWLAVAAFFNLEIERCLDYSILVQQKRMEELRWHWVNGLDFTLCYVYGDAEPSQDALEFKGKVLSAFGVLLISEKGALQSEKVIQDLQARIVQGQCDRYLNLRLETCIFAPLYWEGSQYSSQAGVMVARRLHALVKMLVDSRDALQAKANFHRGMFITFTFEQLDHNDIYYGIDSKEISLLLWSILDRELLDRDFVLLNRLSFEKLLSIKSNIAREMVRCVEPQASTGSTTSLTLSMSSAEYSPMCLLPQSAMMDSIMEDFCQNGNNFSVQDIVIVKLKFQAILDQHFQNGDSHGFANQLVSFAQYLQKFYTEQQKFALPVFALFDLSDQQEEAFAYALSCHDVPGMVRCLLAGYPIEEKKNNYFIPYQEHEKFPLFVRKFMSAALEECGRLLGKPILLDTSDIRKATVPEQGAHRSLTNFSLQLKNHFRMMYLSADAARFSEDVELFGTLAVNSYGSADGNASLGLMQLLRIPRAGMHEAYQGLSSNNTNGFLLWLVDLFISRCTPIEVDVDTDLRREICHRLNIEDLDGYLGNEQLVRKDWPALVQSLKRLANSGVSLQKYESGIVKLAKIPQFHAELMNNPPLESDSVCYHDLHRRLQGIWHIYVSAHLFSVIQDDISLADVHISWEGSYDTAMVDYLVEAYVKEYAAENTNDTDIQATKEILEKGIMNAASSGDVTKRLLTSAPIGLPVSLTDPTWGDNDHIVGITVMGDWILVSDRGVDKFSGMKIYQIGNCLRRTMFVEKCLETLIKSMDYSDYQALLNSLDLRLLHSIPMPRQLKGNCGMSSAAEPLVLGAHVAQALTVLSSENLDRKAMLARAVPLALEKYTSFMNTARRKNVKDLLEFFSDSAVQPIGLYSHIFLMAKKRFPASGVQGMLRNFVSTASLEQAYDDAAHYLYQRFSKDLPNKRADLLPQHALQITQGVLRVFIFGGESEILPAYEKALRCLTQGVKVAQAYEEVTTTLARTPHAEQLKGVLTAVSRVPGMAPLLYRLGEQALRDGVLKEICWQRLPEHEAWFPVKLTLNCSSEAFIRYLRREAKQQGGTQAQRAIEHGVAKAAGLSVQLVDDSYAPVLLFSRERELIPKAATEKTTLTMKK